MIPERVVYGTSLTRLLDFTSTQDSVSLGCCGRADNVTRWGMKHVFFVPQTSWGL